MKIYSKGGKLLVEVSNTSYSGAFMGERFVSCTVKSAEPIQFLPGDYIDYRGERFVLDYTPTDKKTSSVGSVGDAFQYDLKFVSLKHELEKCLFLDVVLNDNDIHYTGLSDVQVFGDAKVLADRILANLNRLYTGEDQWKIQVLQETDSQNISLSDSNCWDAVALFKSLFDLNFTVYGREIKVGTVGKKVEHIFQYGSGKGLTEIVRTAVTGEAVITRLKAFGGNRNLPRDYNKKGLVPESQYLPNLMLPGYSETLIDYIDSNNISIYGVREAVFNDEDIYPSISGMTSEELKAAGVSTGAEGRLDEIVYVEAIQREDQASFNVWIKDIGFNIKDYLTPTTALISMRDGNLGGYEFEITNVVRDSSVEGGAYKLTLNRNQDDNFILPDKKTFIKPGDHFVLLEIYMPEVYVKAAEQRLLKKAQEYLAEYDHVKATYSISMDKVFMAYHPTIGDTIYEGDLVRIVDEDLKLDREIIIQNLTIKNGGVVLEYTVTLSDNPVATTLDRVQDNITEIEQNITANKIDGIKEARRRAIELQLLKSNIFDPDGDIKDTFLQTMMLQVGANSMNYQMGKTTARPRLNNMSFTNTSIKLGADDVIHFAYGAGEETTSTWHIENSFSGTGLIENNTYFVAIKASRDNLSAEWIVDENTYGVESIPGYYVFNFGILSAVTDGMRFFSETRGNIYAYGDELTAGVISSIDRYSWFNLNTGDFQLYNKKTGAGLQFKEGTLTLGTFNPETGKFSSSIGKIENDITTTSQQAADAQQAADEAARKAQAAQNYIDNTLREELDQLHDQADGLVERWDGDYIPSISNYPANQWTTEEEKQRHIDDTFTKNSGSDEYLGNSWKWSKVNGTWQWVLIADTALSAALLQSSEAKDIAKTKSRNFVATPYPPYEIGDIWSQGASGDMMRCTTSRLSGSYVASDWTKASKYTDDTLAQQAVARLTAMSSDGIISKEEKSTLRNDKSQIDKEFAKYQQDATQYGVSISNLQAAYTTLVNFLVNTIKINEDTDFTFGSGQQYSYNQNFANYYAARTSFANEVANKITENGINNLNIGGTNLIDGSDKIYPTNGREYTGIDIPISVFKVGETYTWSFDLKIEGNFPPPFTQVYNQTIGGMVEQLSRNIVATQEWERYSVSFTWKDSPGLTVDYIQMSFYCNYGSGSFPRVRRPKLEQGNKATSWSPSVKDVQAESNKGKLFIRGTGANNSANRIVYLNGEETNHAYNGWGRGLNLTTIKRSNLTIVDKIVFDTYTSTNNPAQALADKLNGLDSSVIVTLTSYDEAASGWTQPLTDAIERCGGSGTVPGYRVPYAFVGIPGIGKGNGIEVMTGGAPTDPYAEISTQIINGIPSGMSNASSVLAKEAQKAADAATSKLNDWASDNKISPTEKTGLKQQLANIRAEYTEISNSCDRLSLKSTSYWTNYNAAYNAAVSALNKYSAATPEVISIESDYANIAAYYPSKQEISEQITNIDASGLRRVLIDASSLDANTYYPVTIRTADHSRRCEIMVFHELDGTSIPPWSTHGSGYSCYCKWTTNGSAWGASRVNRYIEAFNYYWTTVIPIGSIGQMTNSSTEYIYVRGGGKYWVYAKNSYTPTLRTSSYTVSNETISPQSSVTRPLVNVDKAQSDASAAATKAEEAQTVANNASSKAQNAQDAANAAANAASTAGSNAAEALKNAETAQTAANNAVSNAAAAQRIADAAKTAADTAAGKSSEALTAAQNLEFLRAAFDADSTTISGGLVLSSMLGVQNTSGKVVAGLVNGKNPVSPGLMLFAGATSASAMGSAKVRIYADGSGVLAGGNVKWDASGNVTLRGIVYASGGEFTGKVSSNASGTRIELDPVNKKISLVSSSNSEVGRIYINSTDAMFESVGSGFDCMFHRTGLDLSYSGKKSHFGASGIVNEFITIGATNNSTIKALPRGTVIADSRAVSEGFYMLRVKL